MDEDAKGRLSDADHRRHVIRHRNIFEANSPEDSGASIENDRSKAEVARHRGTTINSSKGKPCILGAKCHCICGHKHYSNVDVYPGARGEVTPNYGEATITETHDHCPEHGAAYFS